ncbi:MAG TPA: hypothetical protein VMH87_19845 [Pseudomonadales bacterium]|nr:hypothetical protein [Pseudomonadales bacterium]
MAFESNKLFEQGQANKERREKFAELERYLNMRNLPARMTSEEVAKFFRMAPHDIPVLVSHGLLTPLGEPLQSSVKYFATVVIKGLCENVEWLHEATKTLQGHWVEKNSRRSGNSSQAEKVPSSRQPTPSRAAAK